MIKNFSSSLDIFLIKEMRIGYYFIFNVCISQIKSLIIVLLFVDQGVTCIPL